MKLSFPLAPRYRLDDESPWLLGIDPARHYWVNINGEKTVTAAIPGLTVSSISEFKTTLLKFRALQPSETLTLTRPAGTPTEIHCISENCYAIADTLNNAPLWHLFDRETLESLLMTAHPDWKCAPKDLELGRQLLTRSLQLSIA